MNSEILIVLIFIVPIGIFIWWFIKKRKKTSNSKIDYQKRREDDEVWRTIKNYLKSRGEMGKEIVECYVAKRFDADLVDKKLSKEQQKKQREDIAQRRKEEVTRRKDAKSKGLKYRKPLPKDLYVALFVTRNSKTKIEDEPRAIECSVVNEKINKKDFDRKIVVLRELDYKTEQAWISPIKKKEEDEINKTSLKKLKSQKRMGKIKSAFSSKKSKEDQLKSESDKLMKSIKENKDAKK